MTSSTPPFASMPRPSPLEVQPCCNTGCDLKDRAITAAEAFVAASAVDTAPTLAHFAHLKASLRAYREWRERT